MNQIFFELPVGSIVFLRHLMNYKTLVKKTLILYNSGFFEINLELTML